MIIQINDGRKTYKIQNQDGKVLGSVTFDPTDTRLFRRQNEFLNKLDVLFDELKSIKEGSDDDAVINKEDEIKTMVNSFFNADVVTPFDRIRGLFSPEGNGEYFIVSVLTHLFNIVNDEFKKQSEVAGNRMKEYLEEYTED